MDKLILVTGATGYIASRLIPRLLEYGYRVRCLARDPRRLRGRSWLPHVDVVQGEVVMRSTLAPALDGVHTAYYLIHNMTFGRGYTERELQGARTFAAAAAEAGVEHIIYLGGLADPVQHIAPHMRSRIETGKVLREGRIPVTEFRAGVITGSGSISFEMIRFMTELFPIVPGPTWMNNKSQPIAVQNVIDYLLAALTNPNRRGGVFEIGGPDITTYGDLMMRYARLRGLKRKMLLLPGIPLWFMAFGVGLMTPVPRPIAYALIEGLKNDSVVQHDEALRIYPEVHLIDFDAAAQDALKKTDPFHIERVWDTGEQKSKSIKHEGCFIDHREITARAAPENVFQAITFVVDNPYWCMEANEQKQRMIIREKNQWAGNQWIEWRIHQVSSADDSANIAAAPGRRLTRITQTVFFSPRGLPGFLRWYLLYPFQRLTFRALLRSIARQSEAQ